MGGKRRADEDIEAQLERVRENLRWAAEQARGSGITLLVEALNEWENGPYLFTNTRDTLALLDSLGEPNVKFQYDIYHMQRMEGNIAATIAAHSARIAHIQIADSPGRNQPGTGELRFPFIFEAIVASGYAGAIGLEYHPLGTSEATFGWLPDDRRGGVAVDALRL